MKKILFAIALVASLVSCTKDYKDWSAPQTVPQPDAVTFGNGSVSAVGVIDLNKVTDATVKVCNITAPTASNEAYGTAAYTLDFEDAVFDITAEGVISTAALQDYLAKKFTCNPVERTINAAVTMWIGSEDTRVKQTTSATFQLKAIPEAPEIEQAYYLTGSINGWDNANTTYELTNDGSDPYVNPTFTCRIPAPEDGSNIEFKMTPKSCIGTGDWNKCLAAGEKEGTFNYNNVGNNLVITAVEGAKFYNLTFNMLEQTWSYEAVSFSPFVYFIGATDGWTKAEQRLALTDQSGIYTGYIYCADPNGWGNEFKYQRVANSWDNEINFGTFTGGVTGDLAEGGGGNIKATAGEGVYFFTLNLAVNTLNAVRIQNMNLVGDFNGWNAADATQQMTWNATDYCFEISGAAVTANGWKFTANDAWGINLGGAIDNLVADGSNLSAVGTTIKLYPTRKTSDNIYCTVE